MKSKMSVLLSASVALLLMFSSCKKENSATSASVTDEEAQVMSSENAEADGYVEDADEMGFSMNSDVETITNSESKVIDATPGQLGWRIDLFTDLQFKIGLCTTIEASSYDSVYPKTITVNYGSGCICKDGKFRKGSISFEFSAPLRRPGSVLKITFNDYFVNRVSVKGTRTITNLSSNGAIKFSTSIEGGSLTWPSGRTITYESSKTFTQTVGMDTRTVRDDVYSIDIYTKTVYANGKTVIKTSESPIIKPIACDWRVKGVLKIQINDRTLFLDYGNGDCDNKAVLSWGANSKEITLP